MDEEQIRQAKETIIALNKREDEDIQDKIFQVCYHTAYGGTNDNESLNSMFPNRLNDCILISRGRQYTTEHVVTPGDPEPESLSVAAILLAQMIGAF